VRILVTTLAVAGLVLGGLLSAAEAEAPAKAAARAQLGAGSVGDRIPIAADGDASKQRKADVDFPGLRIANGEVKVRTTVAKGNASARAIAVARTVSLLDGYVTAYGVRRTVTADGQVSTVEGRVDGLKIGDQMIGDVTEEKSYDLPDGAGRVVANHGSVGLRVLLKKASRGFDPGTDIRVAVATATATDGSDPAAEATTTPEPTATAAPAKTKKKKAKLKRKAAPDVEKRLTSGGYAFPVFSDAADTADDWGGPRQIGPHQGNDIFAPFGSPVLAAADGTVHKVGTLPISGNRLWIYTDGGDQFFYAHLSAFAPAAVNGAKVKAGTVLGFVGNTGDAEPTPPHLHFEVHPGGEDAVDPHEILLAWQNGGDVAPGAWLQRVGSDTAERPGALVEVRDFIAGE
jgi:murein DD-endopeptidase MepM/ murein hydrolase activator NlpD